MLLQLWKLGNRLGYQAEAYPGEASKLDMCQREGALSCSLFYARQIADLHIPTPSTQRPASQRMCPDPLDTCYFTIDIFHARYTINKDAHCRRLL